MGQYARESERFYSALSILRNKITGMANDAFTNNGTVVIIDAIATNVQYIVYSRN